MEDSRQSKSTKNNTKWGIKVFQEWNRQMVGEDVDLSSIGVGDLCLKLRQFYAEATPKKGQEYHKNTLVNVRAAINRHLNDIGRFDVDIVRDRSFKSANTILDAKLKANVRDGTSKPTEHKKIICKEDMVKINTYLTEENPVLLRYRVWLNLAMHFVSRGLEFHIQLTPRSFKFLTDENDREYVVLNHETTQKNKQGGLNNAEAPSADKRMYSTCQQCPVKSLRNLISKTDPEAKSLLNHCTKEAMLLPGTEEVWFSTKPVKQYQFARFMGDISRNAKCTQLYTAHCLRATAIQAMSDAGFDLRHIMFIMESRYDMLIAKC
ncbi:uncharacterized protein LOC110453244 [Mizuhopecten yessoensis]|uniref:uncharacterized protein LOC110453244 n=1 Tax=Mizuhopecten yessoensis TaxID=6573 RepID=UPI000B45C909|nr:uncharacterized protein LOC110453244 [Mizuhopecten yessoensis]